MIFDSFPLIVQLGVVLSTTAEYENVFIKTTQKRIILSNKNRNVTISIHPNDFHSKSLFI